MFTQTKIKTNPLFKEKFLIFDAEGSRVDLAAGLNPAPLERTQKFVNPRTSVEEFINEEEQAAGAAIQKPIKETYEGIRDALIRTKNDILSVPQEALDTATGAAGNTVSWATRLAGSTIRLPIAIGAHLASLPFALVGNIGRHIMDIARVPFSATNVAIANISHGSLKVSAKANEYRGKVTEGSDKLDQKILGVGESLKNSVTGIRLPFIGNIKPSTPGAKSNGGDAAPAADAGGGGGD